MPKLSTALDAPGKQSVVTLLPIGFSGGVESVVTDLSAGLSEHCGRLLKIVRFAEKKNGGVCGEADAFCVGPLDQQMHTLHRLAAYTGQIPILMANGVGLDLSLGWYLRKRGTRLVYVLHGNSDYYLRSALHFKPIVDRFVALTEAMAANLRETVGDVPVVVIPNGVPLRPQNHERPPAPEIRLLYVGRIENQLTALERSIDVVAGLESRRIPFRMTYVGDGPYREELEGRMRSLAPRSRVKFLGHLSRAELPRIMARQDVLLLFSRSEGLNMAMLEAMAEGLVPVITETDGVRSIVRHGQNGYVVPQANLGEMVEAIVKLQSDPTMLRYMQHSARQAVAEQFTLKMTAERYDELFEEMQRFGLYTGNVPDLFCRRDLIDFRWIPNLLGNRIRGFIKGRRGET